MSEAAESDSGTVCIWSASLPLCRDAPSGSHSATSWAPATALLTHGGGRQHGREDEVVARGNADRLVLLCVNDLPIQARRDARHVSLLGRRLDCKRQQQGAAIAGHHTLVQPALRRARSTACRTLHSECAAQPVPRTSTTGLSCLLSFRRPSPCRTRRSIAFLQQYVERCECERCAMQRSSARRLPSD